jgi:hypothetical protein
MSETHRLRRILQGIGAVLAGALASIILAIGTDAMLSATGVFPALGQPMGDALLLLATAYRTVYGVAGGYIAARLAPDRPMLHALALGVLGLAACIMGAVVTWNKGPAYGHAGDPLALVALAMPPAWVGGRLREMQLDGRVDG